MFAALKTAVSIYIKISLQQTTYRSSNVLPVALGRALVAYIAALHPDCASAVTCWRCCSIVRPGDCHIHGTWSPTRKRQPIHRSRSHTQHMAVVEVYAPSIQCTSSHLDTHIGESDSSPTCRALCKEHRLYLTETLSPKISLCPQILCALAE